MQEKNISCNKWMTLIIVAIAGGLYDKTSIFGVKHIWCHCRKLQEQQRHS